MCPQLRYVAICKNGDRHDGSEHHLNPQENGEEDSLVSYMDDSLRQY